MVNCRFAIISDLHIALPPTIWNHPNRFHLVEVSIPAFEIALKHLKTLDIDFLLLPGDLTQHGEPANHQWLQQHLANLPFPTYVIPGNHDVPGFKATERSIGLEDFPYYYQQFGYENPHQLYYTCKILPDLQLIALNSNTFDAEGQQLGCLDSQQLAWLGEVLTQVQDQTVLVMVHHNVVEHLPAQSQHQLGQRYMLDHADQLRQMLRAAGVQLVFTGHLHVQDIATADSVYDITTGSLVSYPHPYRVVELQSTSMGTQVEINSYRINAIPGWENLQEVSRNWMGDRAYPFLLRLLTDAPLEMPKRQAQELVSRMRYFWADIAAGDALFEFTEFPPLARYYLEQFGAIRPDGTPQQIDNQAKLIL